MYKHLIATSSKDHPVVFLTSHLTELADYYSCCTLNLLPSLFHLINSNLSDSVLQITRLINSELANSSLRSKTETLPESQNKFTLRPALFAHYIQPLTYTELLFTVPRARVLPRRELKTECAISVTAAAPCRPSSHRKRHIAQNISAGRERGYCYTHTLLPCCKTMPHGWMTCCCWLTDWWSICMTMDTEVMRWDTFFMSTQSEHIVSKSTNAMTQGRRACM